MQNQNNNKTVMIPMNPTYTPELGEAHKEMRNQFNELSLQSYEDDTNISAPEEMMQILEVYALLFNCSKSKAYSNIKFDTIPGEEPLPACLRVQAC